MSGRSLLRSARAIGIAVLVLAATSVHAQTIAIEGGTVHTMTGPPILGGTVLIRDGQIVAVGTAVTIPAGATRIDARGKVVTPGLFDSGTNIGIAEVLQLAETNDAQVGAAEQEDDIAAAYNVADALNPNSMVIPITRIAGVTTAVSRPDGALFSGQGIAIDLLGASQDAMIIRSPVAMFAQLGEATRPALSRTRGGVAALFREVLDDAKAFGANPEAFDRGATRELVADRSDLVALQLVLNRQIPLVIDAHRASDIETALRLSREFGFRLVISGGTEAWMLAGELASAGVPVVLKVLANLPTDFERRGATFENAARLQAAGVRVALTTGQTWQAFDLRQEAGNAVAHGLPYEEALRAITLYPAQVWGIDDRYGTLAVGKVANVVVWEGDPLELLTPVSQVIIRGQQIPLVSRETELRDRYLQIDDSTRPYR